MIETRVNIRCDVCREPFLSEPIEDEGDAVRELLRDAEQYGWKVYRLAMDVYYGKAWCKRCRPDNCKRCYGRGYYPQWPLDPIYGEPTKKDCEVCNGRGICDRPSVAGSP